MGGAVCGPVAPAVSKNIRFYYDLKMQEIHKTISDEFKVITADLRPAEKKMR